MIKYLLNDSVSMTGRIAPKFLEPMVATAVSSVELVTDGVLLVIMLVVILCRVELGGLHNLGYDRFFKGLILFQLCLRLQSQPVLFLIMIKDGASILMSRITELPVLSGRVDIVPKNVQELFVSHFCRIIDHLN